MSSSPDTGGPRRSEERRGGDRGPCGCSSDLCEVLDLREFAAPAVLQLQRGRDRLAVIDMHGDAGLAVLAQHGDRWQGLLPPGALSPGTDRRDVLVTGYRRAQSRQDRAQGVVVAVTTVSVPDPVIGADIECT